MQKFFSAAWKVIFGGLVLISVGGCSTSPITAQTGHQVPADRIYEPLMVGVAATSEAEVSFYRDAGFGGAGCSHDIYVNNVKAFAIRHAEYIHLRLPPGPYFFRLETGGGLCPNIATSQDVTLSAGDQVAYRILLPSDGSLRVARIK